MAQVGQLYFAPDAEHAWVQGVVTAVSGDEITIKVTETGESRTVKTASAVASPPECGLDDMTMIRGINHESAMVECVRTRYMQHDQMYTYVGTGVLIAVNPFQPLAINKPQQIANYRGRDATEMPPHIFILADQAYKAVTQEFVDQAFIVSGESGAGKTESCKLVLSYLSLANARFLPDGTIVKSGGESALAEKLMDQIMASNPVLESFGNAKSVRNNNSSRFGKFLQMKYSNGVLKGAVMNNYLLEKSRVVWQGPEERNYHIFYQVLLGAERDLQNSLFLNNRPPEQWEYLKMSGCTTVPGMNDKMEWKDTTDSMSGIGMSEDEKQSVYRVLAIILHCGEVQFKPGPGDGVTPDGAAIGYIASLLKVSTEDLSHALCFRHMMVGGEEFIKPNDRALASDSRDTVAKTLYSRIFDWLFEKLNELLKPPAKTEGNESFFGVLDIFGFEIFKKNSFEQLCINFTNEKLQQIFILRVFMGEQQEYQSEGLEWKPVDYDDNKPCCDLIEAPKVGVLAMLDEEGTVPKGSDQTWLDKMHVKHATNKFYTKPRLAKTEFIINHYAGPVTYECSGFMDKNKDAVHPDLIKLLASSKEPFIAKMFEADVEYLKLLEEASKGGGKKAPAKLTAGRAFLKDLNTLSDVLLATQAWYVRCIKPNQAKKPRQWTGIEVCRQLQYNNVLETIRVRMLGFLYRRPFDFFIKRFWMCADGPPMSFHPTRRTGDERTFARKMIDAMPLPKEVDKAKNVVCGKTKIFVKSAVELDEIERLRKQRLTLRCVVIQANYKAHFYWKRLKNWKVKSYILQARFRTAVLRRNWIKRYRAARLLQAACRRALPRYFYRNLIVGASLIFGAKQRGPVRVGWNDMRSSAEVLKQKATRAKFISTRRSASRIQAAFRRNFVMNWLAIQRLQAAYRRRVLHRYFRAVIGASRCLRTMLRRRLYTTRRLTLRAAIRRIQGACRRTSLQWRFRMSNSAADKMQSATKQLLYRESYCDLRLAALDSEALMRRQLYRYIFRFARKEVVKLQAACRRQSKRRLYILKTGAAIRSQSLARRKVYARRLNKGILAAIRLGAAARGSICRRWHVQSRAAALRCQAVLRRLYFRSTLSLGVEASTFLQYRIRRLFIRRAYIIARNAIVAIQAVSRRSHRRRRLIPVRAETLTLQAHIQRSNWSKFYRHFKISLQRIQAAVLRTLVRRHFVISRFSSIVLKSRMRFALVHRRHFWMSYAVKSVQWMMKRTVVKRVMIEGHFGISCIQASLRRLFVRHVYRSCKYPVRTLQSAVRRGIWSLMYRQARAIANVVKSKSRRAVIQRNFRLVRRQSRLLQASIRRMIEQGYFRYFAHIFKGIARVVGSRLVQRRWHSAKRSSRLLSGYLRMRKYRTLYSKSVRAKIVLEEMSLYSIRRSSAILLQASLRRAVVRWWLVVGHLAALMLQARIRRSLANHRYIIAQYASLVLTSHMKAAINRFSFFVHRHACSVIQSRISSLLLQDQFNRNVMAALVLQGAFRRAVFENMFTFGVLASRTIQARILRTLTRTFYGYFRNCVVTAQRFALHGVYRYVYLDGVYAARILQSSFRRTDVQMKLNVCLYSAALISSACQRALYSFGFRRASHSALVLQAYCRQTLWSRAVQYYARNAAVIIQAQVSRLLASSRLELFRGAICVLQGAARRTLYTWGVQTYRDAGRLICMTSVRSLYRGVFCVMHLAATILQASILRTVARRFRLRMVSAAVNGQRFVRRGTATYRRHLLLIVAARLQAAARRRIAQTRLISRDAMGLFLSKCARRMLIRNVQYNHMRYEVVVLQAACMRTMASRMLRRARAAAIVLQSKCARVRVRSLMRIFFLQRSAIARLRACVRRQLCRNRYAQRIQSFQLLAGVFCRHRIRHWAVKTLVAVRTIKRCGRRGFCRRMYLRKRSALVRLETAVRRRLLQTKIHNLRTFSVVPLQAAVRRAVYRHISWKKRVPAMVLQARIRRAVNWRSLVTGKKRSVIRIQAAVLRALGQRCLFARRAMALYLISCNIRNARRRRWGNWRCALMLLQTRLRRVPVQRRFLACSLLMRRARAFAIRHRFVNYCRSALVLKRSAKQMVRRDALCARLRIFVTLRWRLRARRFYRLYQSYQRHFRFLQRHAVKAPSRVRFVKWRLAIRSIQAIARRRLVSAGFVPAAPAAPSSTTNATNSSSLLSRSNILSLSASKPPGVARLTSQQQQHPADITRQGIPLRSLRSAAIALQRAVRRKLSRVSSPDYLRSLRLRAHHISMQQAANAIAWRCVRRPHRSRFTLMKRLVSLLETARVTSCQRKHYVRSRSCMAGFAEWDDGSGPVERWIALKNGCLQAYKNLGEATPVSVVTLGNDFSVSWKPRLDGGYAVSISEVSGARVSMSVETVNSRAAWMQALLYTQHWKWMTARSKYRRARIDLAKVRLYEISKLSLELLKSGQGISATSTGYARSMLFGKEDPMKARKPTTAELLSSAVPSYLQSSIIRDPLPQRTEFGSSSSAGFGGRSTSSAAFVLPTEVSRPLSPPASPLIPASLNPRLTRAALGTTASPAVVSLTPLPTTTTTAYTPASTAFGTTAAPRTTPITTAATSAAAPTSSLPSTISPELRTFLERLHSGESPANAALSMRQQQGSTASFASSSRQQMSMSPTRLQQQRSANNPFASPSRPSAASSTPNTSVVIAPLPPLPLSSSAVSAAPSVLLSHSRPRRHLFIFANGARVAELEDWALRSLASPSSSYSTTNSDSVIHHHIASIRVIGASATSALSRVLRGVDPVLVTRVMATGDGVEDAIRLLNLIEAGGAESPDMLLLLWDATGNTSSDFARLLSAAGRAKITTALNTASADKILVSWGVPLSLR